ncbi:MAG TPA: GNAT family N-acetyltransferase [Candidatus Polarisedimenticolia bacterium]|nr:GNAT family N-acetyltransferase [Candidatus Polarisedimenticolia bacterium]
MRPPVAFDTDVVLRDGTTLHLRALRPEDAAALEDLASRLAPLAAVERGPGWPPQPPAPGAPEEDPARQLTIVGEAGGRLVAIARYTRDERDTERAFVGVAVAEPLQGRGLGTRALEILAASAWEHGLRSFVARVPRGAEARLRLFLDTGYAVEESRDAEAVRLRLSLRPTAASRERAARRSESAAAASLRPFFAPQGIAVVGAGRAPGGIGRAILDNLVAHGYPGPLHAVHPEAARIGAVPAVPRVTEISGPLDLAIVSVPFPAVAAVVEDCLAKGVRALTVITAGYGETGADGREREAALLERVRRAGARMVGPNCMGLLSTDPALPVNATFAPVSPPEGSLAMSTQSGALGLVILDYARSLGLGLSSFVSVGNAADVSTNDLMQYWSADPRTRVILLYVESFGNPRHFSRIARRVGRTKPIVAVKSGRSAAGARAASSHTGALASRDAIVDALFRQSGVIRTDTIEEMFDVGMLLSQQPVPRGRRVAILTNAGGPGILAADACEAHGLALPPLSDATVKALRAFLPPEASVANPVDMIASASAEQYERALSLLLRDEAIDSVLVIFIPPLVTRLEDVAASVRRVAGTRAEKPVLGVFMSARGASALVAPIPCFRFPEAAALALARVASYGDWLARPESVPPSFPEEERHAAGEVVERALARGGGWMTAAEVQALLAAMRIPAARAEAVASEEAAVAAAEAIGYPVALKGFGPDLLHKTEAGAVILRLTDATALRAAWRDLGTRLGPRMIGGLVQEMVQGGVEMLAGAVEDETFGPVVACASGGTLTEILADAQFRLHPLAESEAREMIDALRGAPLLRGARGAPPADEGALIDVLLRLSALVGEHPEVREIEINPLVVLPRGARALDARVRVEAPRPAPPDRRIRY